MNNLNIEDMIGKYITQQLVEIPDEVVLLYDIAVSLRNITQSLKELNESR